MDKIMRALIEAKYPNLNADVILDIAHQTPNASIAVEKLCGLHIPHSVEHLGKYKVSRDREPREYELISIDDWREQVTYEYSYEVTEGFYVPKDIDPSIVLTIDNIKDYACSSNSNSKYIPVKTGKMSKTTTTCSIEHWQGLPVPAWVNMH